MKTFLTAFAVLLLGSVAYAGSSDEAVGFAWDISVDTYSAVDGNRNDTNPLDTDYEADYDSATIDDFDELLTTFTYASDSSCSVLTIEQAEGTVDWDDSGDAIAEIAIYSDISMTDNSQDQFAASKANPVAEAGTAIEFGSGDWYGTIVVDIDVDDDEEDTLDSSDIKIAFCSLILDQYVSGERAYNITVADWGWKVDKKIRDINGNWGNPAIETTWYYTDDLDLTFPVKIKDDSNRPDVAVMHSAFGSVLDREINNVNGIFNPGGLLDLKAEIKAHPIVDPDKFTISEEDWQLIRDEPTLPWYHPFDNAEQYIWVHSEE